MEEGTEEQLSRDDDTETLSEPFQTVQPVQLVKPRADTQQKKEEERWRRSWEGDDGPSSKRLQQSDGSKQAQQN
jgi:hypothetical protein